MIDSKEKLSKCLKIEKGLYFPGGGYRLPFGFREKDILYGYIFYLRHTEYYHNTGKKIRESVCRFFLQRMEMKYAIHIDVNVCDEGLSIAHVGPIVIHGRSRIGKNLRIHVGVNIGANGGVYKNWEIMCILDQALNYLEILQLLMDAVLERMR